MKRIVVLILMSLLFCQSVEAKSKTHVKRGLIIGASSGAVVGLSGSLWFVSKFQTCRPYNYYDDCLDVDDKVKGVFFSTLGTAAVGTGLGALIGSLIPTSQDVSVLPYVTQDENSKPMGGVSLTKSF